jgi:hypothetical protein
VRESRYFPGTFAFSSANQFNYSALSAASSTAYFRTTMSGGSFFRHSAACSDLPHAAYSSLSRFGTFTSALRSGFSTADARKELRFCVTEATLPKRLREIHHRQSSQVRACQHAFRNLCEVRTVTASRPT